MTIGFDTPLLAAGLFISTNLAIADLIIPDNNKTQANQVNNIPVVDIAVMLSMIRYCDKLPAFYYGVRDG
ncbi:hypothetical protein A9255_09415 [Xenorhabdus hominickii]|uniref:Uncharacterized protein n=1 Tax=Xenorhabdus hominickii TaxID=351679 RepID=A0ABN4S3V7_XENHO|nr:hypothetical protein A9255_09415 [Xenorhabdus hominickii]